MALKDSLKKIDFAKATDVVSSVTNSITHTFDKLKSKDDETDELILDDIGPLTEEEAERVADKILSQIEESVRADIMEDQIVGGSGEVINVSYPIIENSEISNVIKEVKEEEKTAKKKVTKATTTKKKTTAKASTKTTTKAKTTKTTKTVAKKKKEE